MTIQRGFNLRANPKHVASRSSAARHRALPAAPGARVASALWRCQNQIDTRRAGSGDRQAPRLNLRVRWIHACGVAEVGSRRSSRQRSRHRRRIRYPRPLLALPNCFRRHRRTDRGCGSPGHLRISRHPPAPPSSRGWRHATRLSCRQASRERSIWCSQMRTTFQPIRRRRRWFRASRRRVASILVLPLVRQLLPPLRKPPSVPEVTVDENGHAISPENEVRSTGKIASRGSSQVRSRDPRTRRPSPSPAPCRGL